MKERIRPVQAQPIRERQVLWVLFTAYMAILCYLLFLKKHWDGVKPTEDMPIIWCCFRRFGGLYSTGSS